MLPLAGAATERLGVVVALKPELPPPVSRWLTAPASGGGSEANHFDAFARRSRASLISFSATVLQLRTAFGRLMVGSVAVASSHVAAGQLTGLS